MILIPDKRSILAVDPAPAGLAYVFFEGGELRDWGRRFVAADDGALLRVLHELITRLAIDVVVLENGDAPRSERRPRARHILRLFASEANRLKRSLVLISRYEIRLFWQETRGLRTKQQVAVALAGLFPELEPLVPRVRKPWRSEDSRANVFDAVTLVMFAFPPDALSR